MLNGGIRIRFCFVTFIVYVYNASYLKILNDVIIYILLNLQKLI